VHRVFRTVLLSQSRQRRVVGTTKPDPVVKALKGQKFDTVLGSIGFDRKGDPTGETYVMYEWTKGKLKYAKM
ncbi:MAG: hypothetical protein V3U93_09520, partial [Alphaproteobacteria bacterium]